MCGIAGLVDLKRALPASELGAIAKAMADAVAHRGPDDAGVYVDAAAGVALSHRRLSIIDLRPEARQPMSGDGVDAVVTFNGEIYNFESIRCGLERRGTRFRSLSDTEVLPHLFRDVDPAGLGRLNGMFAFGVWNPTHRRLMLARDSFGKKPLYVYQDDHFLAFASEMQCFYALPGFDAEVDQDSVARYLMLGYVPAPATIYRRVRQVDAGGYEIWSTSTLQHQAGRFFRFEAEDSRRLQDVDRDTLKDRLLARLIEAVERRMIADVPLGAFLSGGVDSALVCSIVRRELGRPLETFSIGFSDTVESEHEAAREIAAHLGTDHHDRMIAPDGLEAISRVAQMLDQPNGDSSCLPTYLLSGFAREHVTVCLSGDGGDELFGGYGRYRDTLNDMSDPHRARSGRGLWAKPVTPADLYLSLRSLVWTPRKVAELMGGMPEDAAADLERWRAVLNDSSRPLMHRMRTLDAQLYMPGAVLPKVDRMSMQHGLEVRCPLLDPTFADLAMGLDADDCWAPPDVTKKILKEIAIRYLPHEWMHRSKKGFGLPSNAWASEAVLAMGDILLGADAVLNRYLQADRLRATFAAQKQTGGFSIYQMWPTLVLELWLRDQPAKIARIRCSVAALSAPEQVAA